VSLTHRKQPSLIKFQIPLVAFLVLVTLLFATLPRAGAATITINSSSAVTFLDSGLVTTDFPAAFTAANFTAAQTGPAASVLTSTPFYVSSLVDGPGAVWIGTNSSAGTSTGDTALYAISFNLASAPSTASLNLYYAVDNELGLFNPGIYINGTALPSSTGIPCVLCFTSFDQENNYIDASIGSLLVSGTNRLYIDAVNQGLEAGLIFSATIDTAPSTATPEPSGVLLLGTGLLGVGITAFRRRTTTPPRARIAT
jgi:PEP-CTERM motif